MTIYVDDVKYYPNTPLRFKYWSHMMTDLDDLTELHQMAQRLSLKREWFQNKKNAPHYDVIPSKRELAIKYGAIAVDSITLCKKCFTNWKNRDNPTASESHKTP